MMYGDSPLLRRHFIWLATAVLLLAAIFRLVMLSNVPPGLAQDEVLNADIALFIRQGQHALFFREGYGHEPLYHYFAVPFQVLLGDNVLSVRLPALYLGMLLVALVLRWVFREWGSVAALVTGAGLAVSWWPIIFSRIGLRPISFPLLLVIAAMFWKRPFVAGLLLGLSYYTYTGARIIFILPIGFALLQRISGQHTIGGLAWWRWLALVLGMFVLVAAPMQITLWRDPTLQQRVDQLAGPLDALRAGDWRPVWETAVATLGVVSFSGDPRWTYTIPDRPLFDWVTAVMFYIGLGYALWAWRDRRNSLLLVWLVVGLIPSAVTPQAPSTVRLVGAMPIIYLLVGLGASCLFSCSRRLPMIQQQYFVKVLITLVIAMLSWQCVRTIQDGFVAWPAALETRLKYQTVLRDIGSQIEFDQPMRLVVVDGFFEPIDADSLRRMTKLPVPARWVQSGADVAGAVVFPAGNGKGRIYVPEYAPVPADLLRMVGVGEQPISRSVTIPSYAIYDLPTMQPRLANETDVQFDYTIRLIGYETLPGDEGQPLRLYTMWQVVATLPADLSIFVHVLDANGEIVSQHDGLDAAAVSLQAGDVFVQRHLLALDDLPVGEYQLFLGLYTRGNGRRYLTTDRLPQSDNVRLSQVIRIDGK